jgi:hypothetical protein
VAWPAGRGHALDAPRGICQRIESEFWPLKDRLGLEEHPATLIGLRIRIAAKLLALAAGVALTTGLGPLTRAFAAIAGLTEPVESII